MYIWNKLYNHQKMRTQSIKKSLLFILLCSTFAIFLAPAASASETEIPIQVSPGTLSMLSQGEWITVHADVKFSLVTDAEITLNGVPVVTSFADDRGYLVCKFYLSDIKNLAINVGTTIELKLTVFIEGGETYVGYDTLRIVVSTPKRAS